jgi:acetyl-CoA acetyltransferase
VAGAKPPFPDVAIVGVHITEQARVIEKSQPQLIIEAVKGALDDAGLTPADVDGVALDVPDYNPSDGSGNWARMFGHTIRYRRDHIFDFSGTRGVATAAGWIQQGLAHTIVLGGGTVGTSGNRVVSFDDPYGAYDMAYFALVAQRHMHEFGTTKEQLARAAMTTRNNGYRNPEAVYYGRGPYTIDDILASRVVASPLHLLMCCPMNHGACALVLTTKERAKDLKSTPVDIIGAGFEYGYGHYPATYQLGMFGTAAADTAFGLAGIDPTKDVDVFCLYDQTAFEIIRQMEVLGLCKEGEGGPFVESGAIAPEGRYPVNLDGGVMAHGWILHQQMTNRVIEGVRQLRGTAKEHQHEGAKVAVVSGAGSAATRYELLVLAGE